jgi:lysophospholipase L1-like esterase
MRQCTLRLIIAALCSGLVLVAAGCGRPNAKANMPPSAKVARVSRTARDRENLVKPDGRRLHGDLFDCFNEQIVREDRDVGTIFLGDSITEAWDLHVFFTPALGELLVNRGISGDTAEGLSKRFQADVIQLRPRNVVILVGTNDVVRLSDKGKTAREIEDQVTATVESMVDEAQAAGINVLLCSILPTGAEAGKHAKNPEIRVQINQRLAAVCQAKKCVYVDYAAAMRGANGGLRDGLARDGLHPDWAGLKIMARVLLDTMREHGLRL